MRPIKFFKTVRKVLNDTPVLHGNLIYCTDTMEVFYDYDNDVRGSIDCTVCQNEGMRIAIPANKRRYNTLYYVLLTEKYYILDPDLEDFREVHYLEDITHITGEFINLSQGFLHDEIKHYAPYTTSGSIIMEDSMSEPNGPYTLQDYINSGKIGPDGFGTEIRSEITSVII